MAILHDKFLFLHMPRTAGTSISRFLMDNIPGCRQTARIDKIDNKVIRQKEYCHIPLHRLDEDVLNTFSFGFIRNPFDWYVSWWSWSKPKWAGEDKIVSFDEYIKRYNQFEMLYEFFGSKYTHLLPKGDTIPVSYLKYLLDSLPRIWMINIGYMTWHFFNTFCKIYYDDNMIYYDVLANKVLKYEDGIANQVESLFNDNLFAFNEDQVQTLYNFEKQRTSEHNDYLEYYTDELTELVLKRDDTIFNLYPEYLP